MKAFDASSMIYAWDNYPPEQFPPVWNWMYNKLNSCEFTIPYVALEEVIDHAPDCAEFLKQSNVKILPINDSVMSLAFDIKTILRINEDHYHQDGVGENDLLIIATAAVENYDLISNEKKQNDLPRELRKYKIPAVCNLSQVNVACYDFLKLVRNSGEVFG